MFTTSSTISASGLGNLLEQILMSDDIVPGSQPGYLTCRLLYTAHPLGGKVVEMPVRMATSQKRIVTIQDTPDDVRDAFEEARVKLRCDYYIRNAGYIARIYGVGSLVCGTIGKDPAVPLEIEQLRVQDIYFSVMDPLNTAGSIVLDQNPNSPNFQKVGDITVAGTPWHRSRVCVLMNEVPIYLSYTDSAFGFSGRSVFARALYPMKSYIQSLVTDDMVSRKSGLLIAFMKQPGTIINSLMEGAARIKRFLLREATVGNVLSVSNEDRIESIDMQNIDKSMQTARSNIIKNIATAVPMPAQILEQESFAEGFGEGTEDTKNVVRFVNEVREELEPLYAFTDQIAQRAAWSPEFIQTMRVKYREVYGGKSDEEIFYGWKNKFRATWPNLHEEPDSEKSKQEKVKVEGLAMVYEMLAPRANADNLAALADWAQGNLNEYRNLYPVPLSLDPEGMAEAPQEVPGDRGASNGRPVLRLVRPPEPAA